MKFTFLGTGTSQGVPVVGCRCHACTSKDPKDERLRTSLLVESGHSAISIDVGPDFRYQMLREDVRKLDAVVITHEHNDHIAGLDDVRAFNFIQQKPMEVYATEATQAALRKKFYYVFEKADYPGLPQIILKTIGDKPFKVGDIEMTPIPVMHADMPVLGFRMGDFTYITDANYIGETEKNLARGSKYLVLNALRKEPHHSHFTLSEAVALSRELEAEHTYLTHISHQMGRHEEISKQLPKGVELAYDGLVVESE